jgi:hypothetical protein
MERILFGIATTMLFITQLSLAQDEPIEVAGPPPELTGLKAQAVAGVSDRLKSLKRDMGDLYPNTYIEMRQIGPRDVAKIIGGMGACGLETRCCSQFLTEFSPISIKMAKEQGISLTPEEITGMCGRLRCCLIYEYDQYVEARKQLPKRNKKVITPKGEGKVIDVLPMSNQVVVLIENEEGKRFRETFIKEDIQPWAELDALKKKSQAPCDRHEGGGCTCGKAKSSPRKNNRNNRRK